MNTTCPWCGASMKVENYDEHLRKHYKEKGKGPKPRLEEE